MSRQNLSRADELFAGRVSYNRAFNAKTGIPAFLPYLHKFGAIAVADADGLINDATSTELPNNETVTYTFPAANVSPTDEALRSGILDTPRNVVAVVTHGSSVVAMTILVTGTDQYGETMSELLTVPATGTTQTVNGAKAFKTITSVAIASGTDAEANTLNLGTGDVIGLPFRSDATDWLRVYICTPPASALQDGATVVRAVTSAATTTTGDVRGTFNPSGSIDGTNQFYVEMELSRNTSKERSYGVAQA